MHCGRRPPNQNFGWAHRVAPPPPNPLWLISLFGVWFGGCEMAARWSKWIHQNVRRLFFGRWLVARWQRRRQYRSRAVVRRRRVSSDHRPTDKRFLNGSQRWLHGRGDSRAVVPVRRRTDSLSTSAANISTRGVYTWRVPRHEVVGEWDGPR